LLMYEVYNAIALKGLNPYAGFMHKDKHGHPALASDLLEEWRPVIVDSLVMNLLNNQGFSKDDFVKDSESEAVFIEKTAIKKFVRSFEDKIRTETSYLSYIDYPVSFRKAILFQVGVVIKAIEENNPSIYLPIRLR